MKKVALLVILSVALNATESFINFRLPSSLQPTVEEYRTLTPEIRNSIERIVKDQGLNQANPLSQVKITKMLAIANLLSGLGINWPSKSISQGSYHTSSHDKKLAKDIFTYVHKLSEATMNQGLRDWAQYGYDYYKDKKISFPSGSESGSLI